MDTQSISIRVEPEMLDKLYYISKYEDRSLNGEIVQLIRKRVREFEAAEHPIDAALAKGMRGSGRR